jgi:hypothetical protein
VKRLCILVLLAMPAIQAPAAWEQDTALRDRAAAALRRAVAF